MTLAEYVAKHGKGSKQALADATGLRWQTIHHLAEGVTTPRLKTAIKLQAATGGACTVPELLGVDPAELVGGDRACTLAATGLGAK